MSYHKLPEGLVEFVRENAEGRSSRELAQMVNDVFGTSFTAEKIKSFKAYRGIRSNIQPKPPTVLPESVRAFVRENCQGVRYADMAELVRRQFGVSITNKQMRWFYQNNELKSCVRVNSNEAPLGTVIVDKAGYLRKKVATGRWELLHRLLWEEVHGEIPEGCNVTFLDGDKSHVCIENLALITNEEQMIMTRDGLRFSDSRRTETGLLIAKVRVLARKKGGDRHG